MTVFETLLGKTGRQYAICCTLNLLTFNAVLLESGPKYNIINRYYIFGGMFTALLFGCFVNSFGRKTMLIVAAISIHLSHILTSTSEDLSRFLAGTGSAGVRIITPIYIGEIAEKDIRGKLGSYFNLFQILGLLFSYIMENQSHHNSTSPAMDVSNVSAASVQNSDNVSSVNVSTIINETLCSEDGNTFPMLVAKSFPLLILLAFIWIPESPVYLLRKNKTEEALKALRKIRGYDEDFDGALINREFRYLVSSVISSNKIRIKENRIVHLPTIKALGIACVLFIMQKLSFYLIMSMSFRDRFSGLLDIFNSVSSKLVLIPSILSPLLGAVAAISLVERMGRKFLLSVSLVGMTLAVLHLLVWFQVASLFQKDDPSLTIIDWIPVASSAVYVMSYYFGIGPVPWILISEIFTVFIRGPAVSFFVFSQFIVLIFLDFKKKETSLHEKWLVIWAVTDLVIAIFSYVFIPETKQKSLEEVLEKLKGEEENGNDEIELQ